jgi:hypothetical protein
MDEWMDGWVDVSLDFIHVDENMFSFFLKYLIYIYIYISMSGMRTTEEEGVLEGS